MLRTLKKHHISFKHAYDGILYAFSTQPNFRIHLFLSISIIIAGIVFRISLLEFVIIVFTIMLGIITEMLNTSIESITDLVSNKWSMEAKIAKDVAAGMMLLTATGALVVACVIFLPKIINILRIL
jgi:diacylglycerol kinase (ATP)